MIITHCSKANFDRQKPTLGKMYETNSDGYHNFFLNCKKYFRLISLRESLPIFNHKAPTIFFNSQDPLSKLGVTVEVRSFDGTQSCRQTRKGAAQKLMQTDTLIGAAKSWIVSQYYLLENRHTDWQVQWAAQADVEQRRLEAAQGAVGRHV